MFKKMLYTGISLSVLTIVSACGNTTEEGESAEEIVKQSQTTMNDVESYVLNMDMLQTMKLDGMDEDAMSVRSTQTMEMTMDPMTFKQDMTMNYEDMDEFGEMDDSEGQVSYQSFFTETDGLFMEDPMMDRWMKFPESYLDDFLAMSDLQLHPDEQLAFLKDYVADLSLEEDDEYYYIALKTEDLNMEELMQELHGFDADIPGMEGMDELFGSMELRELDFSITIDKETYYQTAGSITMVMALDMMGQEMITNQTSEMTMSDFNTIEPIPVPDEVLENAEEISEDEFTPGM
ncbi:DUF6612 family protein [Salisediminibacterium beveridgei]|uniref:Lipoprotein n=1 Tax=Salisediminibacterium beveridgei TaxID=632773 RepID=A0A1D7QSS7_9BACI|nr:DUF6612 family protein [Salisediminibacterium beveridgei]AOM82047.1 hypothetical protein BBEV_0674 [Salisediminibacterium beveridgei]